MPLLKKLVLFLVVILLTVSCGEARPENKAVLHVRNERKSEASKLSSERAEEIFAEADNLKYAGNFKSAVAQLKFLVDNNVKNVSLYKYMLDDYMIWLDSLSRHGDKKEFNKIIPEAIRYAKKAVKDFPNELSLHYKLAEFLRVNGEATAMKKALEQVLILNPNDVFAHYYLGLYEYYSGRYYQAKIHLLNVRVHTVAKNAFDYNTLFQANYYLGMLALNGNKLKLAARYFTDAGKYSSSGTQTFEYLAPIETSLLEFKKALAAFQHIPEDMMTPKRAEMYAGVLFVLNDPRLDKVVEEYRDSSGFFQALAAFQKKQYGLCLKKLKGLKSAGGVFYVHFLRYRLNKALGLQDNVRHTLYQLVRDARRVTQNKLALKYSEWELKQRPNDMVMLYFRAVILANLKRFPEAEKILEGLTVEKPGNVLFDQFAEELLKIYYQNHREEKAQKLLNILESRKRDRTDQKLFLFNTAFDLMDLKKYGIAERLYRQLYALDNNHVGSYFFLASSLAFQGKNKQAILYLEQAMKYFSGNNDVENLLAYLYAEEDIRLDKAIKLSTEALKNRPDSLAYLDTRAWVLFKSGKTKEALKQLLQIELLMSEKEDEGKDDIYYHIGRVYESMKQPEIAAHYYRKALDVNDQNLRVKDRLARLFKETARK